MQSSLNAHLATVAAGFRRSFRRFILDQPQPLEIGAVLDGISVLHPLSGIQTSILFQHLAGEAGVPPYVVQVSCALCGRFNLDAFQQAWQRVVARHESLRTSFHWLELDAPVQAVHRELRVPVKMLDWRGQDAASQGVGLTSLLRADRSAPFVLDGAAPLMRITLVRVADERTFCIWTHHHIQLDGWSQIVVLRELFQHYAALLAGETLALPAPPTLGEYFHALERFPAEAAQRYWREYLKGFIQPTPIAAHAGLVADRDAHEDYREQHIDIDTLTSEAAYEFARASSLTVQTLVRVAWGLWLALHGGRDDVLFGTIVAGRNCDLPCGDHLVGTLINTIPVRMRFDQDVSLIEWLRAAQDGQAASHAYELLPLAQIVKLAQTDRDRLLFESILVFENLPGDYAQLAALAGFRLEELNFAIRENYPLVVSVRPARNLAVRISYRAAHVDARIEHLGAFLGLALTAMIRHKDQPLKQLTRAVRDSYFG